MTPLDLTNDFVTCPQCDKVNEFTTTAPISDFVVKCSFCGGPLATTQLRSR